MGFPSRLLPRPSPSEVVTDAHLMGWVFLAPAIRLHPTWGEEEGVEKDVRFDPRVGVIGRGPAEKKAADASGQVSHRPLLTASLVHVGHSPLCYPLCVCIPDPPFPTRLAPVLPSHRTPPHRVCLPPRRRRRQRLAPSPRQSPSERSSKPSWFDDLYDGGRGRDGGALRGLSSG